MSENDKEIKSATVWVCDGNPYEGINYGSRLAERIEEIGISCGIRDLTKSSIPESKDKHLNLITGGSTSVNNTDSWMMNGLRTTEGIIENIRQGSDEYLLGVCLGSQMIAHILAPGSIISGDRMEAGIVPLEWNNGIGPKTLPSFHYERIDKELLESSGAEVEAWNERVPILAYSIGEYIAGTQLHPEFSKTDVGKLLKYNEDLIKEYDGDINQIGKDLEELSSVWSPETAMKETIERLLPTIELP